MHSLARVLGTTSRRVLDALAELDGRARSAHSTVDKAEAERVREVLGGSDGNAPVEAPAPAEIAEAAAELPEVVIETVEVSLDVVPVDDTPEAEDEPESRTILEAAPVERADYLPLFVAPQPVRFEPADEDDDEDEDEDDDTATSADSEDDDQEDQSE
ncbi:MAG: ribonuclease E/G, partial [Actinomycetota bacterium]|nr:ribonuclease E/G [Actinomycetota bacterium]